ncbi:hypothetical protein [Ferrovibrio sp.]|uniref:hypothetical protein n=1 Tax=Ferrovibrio sp. TaxID=1917215 RepID=UPI0035132A2D
MPLRRRDPPGCRGLRLRGRILYVLLCFALAGTLAGVLTPAPARAAEAGLNALRTAQDAAEMGDQRLAALALYAALHLGIPDRLVPAVEATLCVTSMTIAVDKAAFDFCRSVLRHGGADGRDHAEALGSMLASIAMILADEGQIGAAEWAVDEFAWRFGGADYDGLDYMDLDFDRQRTQLARAEIRRQRGDPATALVLIDQISRERLQFPHDLDRADAELRALQVLRVRLFAAHDTGDRDQMHDSIERIARISEGLRTPAGLDYAGGLLICQAYLLAGRPEKSDRALIEQVDLRTDGLLLFLERANEKDPQHQPLQHEAWRLVRRCAPDVYFVLIPADIAGRLVDRGLGPQTVDALLDDYRDARYAEAGQRFDALIAALRAETHPRARQLARRLELLRLYLLAPPGRIERG